MQLISRRSMRWIGAVALLLTLFYAGITLTPWSIGLCGEHARGEAYSPDRRYLAKAFIRNCGATTGLITHVNLRSGWSYFNPTLVGMIDEGQVFTNDCGSKVNLVWIDSSHLEIQYERCARRSDGKDRAFLKAGSWKKVKVTYQELPRETERKPQ